ncbi:hypothetical protein HMPREF1246_1856 [Acidaminococcus sp. BV3L6]|nr:hypothetical protein HMPREF1246_1856 [Acidaminococcus sp. BV3L6]
MITSEKERVIMMNGRMAVEGLSRFLELGTTLDDLKTLVMAGVF